MTISSSFFINTVEDGSFQQQVFKRTTTNETPTKPATSQSDNVPEGWTAYPLGVDSNNRYEWVSMRTKTNNTWSEFSTPARYAYFAADGRSISINGSFTKAQVIASQGGSSTTDIKNYLSATYPSAQQNDGYMYEEDGHLWVWNGSTWQDVGQIQGPEGKAARYLIAENSNVSYLYSSTGELLSSTVALHVQFAHDGVIDNTPNASFTPSTGVTGHGVTDAYWVLDGIATTSGTVTASYTYDGVTYTTVINVTRVVGKNVYDLVVNPISIPYNSTTDSPATTTVVAQAYVTKANGTRSLVESLPSGMSLRRYTDDSSSYDTLSFSVNASWAFTSDNSEHNKYRLVLVSNSGANIEDTQDVVIVKAANGQDGIPGNDGADAYDAEAVPNTLAFNATHYGTIKDFTSKSTTIKLYKGGSEQTIGASHISIGALPFGLIPTISNNVVSFQFYQTLYRWSYDVYTTSYYPSVGSTVYQKSGSTWSAYATVASVSTGYMQLSNGFFVSLQAGTEKSTLADTINAVVTVTYGNIERTINIPIIPNKEGGMGKNYYYMGLWGSWSSVPSGTIFEVSDNIAPYLSLMDGSIERFYMFVGEATGNLTKAQVGDPTDNSNTNWTPMYSENKYLITEAIFSRFAKLGSGIFNGDYAFSQYGTLDGVESDEFQYFNPLAAMSEMSVVITEANSASNKVALGSFKVKSGTTYTLHFEHDVADDNIIYECGGNTWHSGDITFNRSETPSSNTTWTLKVYYGSTNAATRKCKVYVTPKVEPSTQSFKPNIVLNWLTGEIYSQLGHFVNVTVEGVMNNLMQTITDSNYGNYGYSGGSGQPFWLNPTKVGSIVAYNANKPLGLPSAWYVGEPDAYYMADGGIGITLDELRQCVGKKIYLYTANNSSMQSFYCGISGNGMFVYETNHNSLEDITSDTTETVRYNRVYQYVSPQSLKNSFFVLECKLGEYANHECIYWGITRSAYKMDYIPA